MCNPQNEQSLPGQSLTECVYVCRYKKVHICTDQHCDNHLTGICNISGACYGPQGGFSSYDKNNPQTWGRDFRRRELSGQTSVASYKKRKRAKPTGYQRRIVMGVIDNLFYSSTRKQVNAQKEQNDEKRYRRHLQTYVKECAQNRVPPCLIYMMMLKTHYKSAEYKLEILKYDADLVERYVDIVLRVHQHAQTYLEETVKLEALALGTLYEMQQGFKIGGVVLLPSDVFLLHNLPSINDIPTFGYAKKKITSSQHKIEFAFKEALNRGVPAKEIAFVK